MGICALVFVSNNATIGYFGIIPRVFRSIKTGQSADQYSVDASDPIRLGMPQSGSELKFEPEQVRGSGHVLNWTPFQVQDSAKGAESREPH
jgi:hypothetical protein